MGNLSNIEIFNNKYLDSTPIIPTVPDDQLIVETVEYDTAEILEHADILYKKDIKKGWKAYHYKCKHCGTKVTRSLDMFIKHLEVCEGLDD
mgnify:CR=1 FL=1